MTSSSTDETLAVFNEQVEHLVRTITLGQYADNDIRQINEDLPHLLYVINHSPDHGLIAPHRAKIGNARCDVMLAALRRMAPYPDRTGAADLAKISAEMRVLCSGEKPGSPELMPTLYLFGEALQLELHHHMRILAA